VLAPRANITKIDNDLTAWFSREDPIYQEYERFRDEFGGTRTFIIAVEAPSRDRLFSRESFDFLDQVSADIERVATVERVNSLGTVAIVDARPGAAGSDADFLDVRRLTKDLETRSPAEVGQRALDDELIRGDLVSEDGTVTAIVVSFDERVSTTCAPNQSPASSRSSRPAAQDFRATSTAASKSARPTTASPSTTSEVHAADSGAARSWLIFVMFRSWRQTLLTLVAVLVSVSGRSASTI
jgi:predicted RND superfamily exporter protein